MSEAPNPDPRWEDWIGREQTVADTIDLDRARAMQATLDDGAAALAPGDPLPPLWHGLYFWWVEPASALGPDGHPARGGFLPSIELPRRMWAGSRVIFHRPVPIGAKAVRRSVIADVRSKTGRSGRLMFVTVRHEIAVEGAACIEDEHDIVYREAPSGPAAKAPPGDPAPGTAAWRRVARPDPVLLFRYSALTFNGHRIHYDRPYATGVEGYPGLVVHGPLLATLMIEQVRAAWPRERVGRFSFRALRPIFDTAPFTVAGQPDGDGQGADVWVADSDGLLAMRGRVELS